jgi:hypothetical protein
MENDETCRYKNSSTTDDSIDRDAACTVANVMILEQVNDFKYLNCPIYSTELNKI